MRSSQLRLTLRACVQIVMFTVAVVLTSLVYAAQKETDTTLSDEEHLKNWEKTSASLHNLPAGLTPHETRQAESRLKKLGQAISFEANAVLSEGFAAYWKKIQPVCDRPDIEFKVYVYPSHGSVCCGLSDGSLFIPSSALERLDDTGLLYAEWAREIAHVVMKHQAALQSRETNKKAFKIIAMVAITAATTAVSANNPLVFSQGNTTYSTYFVVVPNPIWVAGCVADQPTPLMFPYKEQERTDAMFLALTYLHDAGLGSDRLIRRMQELDDPALRQSIHFLAGIDADSLQALPQIYSAPDMVNLADLALMSYGTTPQGRTAGGTVLYRKPVGRGAVSPEAKIGHVDYDIVVPIEAYRKYFDAKMKQSWESILSGFTERSKPLEEKLTKTSQDESVPVFADLWILTAKANRNLRERYRAGVSELHNAVEAAARDVSKENDVSVVYSADATHNSPPGSVNITEQYLAHFKFLDNYR